MLQAAVASWRGSQVNESSCNCNEAASECLRLDDAEDYGPRWRDPKERHLLGWKNKQQLFVSRYRENGITRPNIYHENNYHRWINISFDCILKEWCLLSLKILKKRHRCDLTTELTHKINPVYHWIIGQRVIFCEEWSGKSAWILEYEEVI